MCTTRTGMQLAEWIGKRLMRPYACKFVALPQDRPLLDELQTREELDMDPADTAFSTFNTDEDGGLLLRPAARPSVAVSAALSDAEASLQCVAEGSDGSDDGGSGNSEEADEDEGGIDANEGTGDAADAGPTASDAGNAAAAHTRRCGLLGRCSTLQVGCRRGGWCRRRVRHRGLGAGPRAATHPRVGWCVACIVCSCYAFP
jgi:hypothetical protein